MSGFVYDRLLERKDICNLKAEQKTIETHIANQQNVVLYAPRNFGKTSLVKSIIIPDFKKKYKNSLTYFVDLMGVKDMQALVGRLERALDLALKENFPVKHLVKNFADYLKNLRADLTLELNQDGPKLKLNTNSKNNTLSIADIFQILANINKKHPCLIIIDEFQDIAALAEAEALFRDAFQKLNIPIIVLGSKKHILSEIFAKPQAPLANFGNDVLIKPIIYKEYHKYMTPRFAAENNKIDFESAKYLQDLMLRVPESVNILCSEINLQYKNQEITKAKIDNALDKLLSNRQARFEFLLQSLSKAEESILIALANLGGKIAKPLSKDFVATANLTPRSISVNIKKLMDLGFLEKDKTYYINDALLLKYLQSFRK